MQMRAKRPHRFPFTFFGLRFTLSLRARCCVDRLRPPFLREAQAAAALHHPNICPVYEIDEVDGKTFISMAFLEGETLEDRIAEGPLSIKDALDVARQVADGLDAAHEKGVFHRDIKPANIMIDAKGRATIMDFGLARLTEASRLTKHDTAMGTVAYMSPEQGQGMEVDGRTDIWALGCVLYEMVSGQRPFQGQYDQALLYEIVHEEVAPLTSIRAGVPMELEFAVGKCLEKDADSRYQHASEVAVDLHNLQDKLRSGRSTILRTTPMTGAVPATMTGAQTLNPTEALPAGAVIVQQRKLRALQAVAAVAVLALLGSSYIHFTQAEPEESVARFSFTPEGLERAVVSPDGQYILYTALADGETSLWVRAIANESPRRLEHTEGVRRAGFWSPDSSSIGFADATELKRVSLDGGNPITLCELPTPEVPIAFMGGTWSPDGERIVFSSGLQLYGIPARGGTPESVRETQGFEPHFLPTDASSSAVVYTGLGDGGGVGQRVAILNLETGEQRDLGPGDEPVYSSDGYLVSGPGSDALSGLSAMPFSLATLEPTGEAFPIEAGGHRPSVSRDGTLVYSDHQASGFGGFGGATLVWRNRAGELLETVGQPQNMALPALSPDGQRVAVRSNESGNVDICIHDLTRSTKTRLTFEDVTETFPAWSPSGQEIAYRQVDPGPGDTLMRKSADGTGEAIVLVESERDLRWPDWSHDGRHLVYTENNSETGNDIRYVELGTDGDASEPVTFLSTPANEVQPQLSPDGRYLAYESSESGSTEIYVQPFPDGAGKWQVSVNGGNQIRWRSDGSELFYVEDRTLMVVSVSTEQGFTLGQPQMLFASPNLARGVIGGHSYDVSADGQRFVMTAAAQEGDDAKAAPPSIRIVENWYEEFRDREQ